MALFGLFMMLCIFPRFQYQTAQARESAIQTALELYSTSLEEIAEILSVREMSTDCRGDSHRENSLPFRPLSLTAFPALGMHLTAHSFIFFHPSNTYKHILILDVTEMPGEGGFLVCIKWTMPPWAENRQPWGFEPPAWLSLCRRYRTLWAYIRGGWAGNVWTYLG